MVAWDWEGEGMGSDCNRCGVSFGGDENVLNLDCGDVCTTVNILKISEFYTLNK